MNWLWWILVSMFLVSWAACIWLAYRVTRPRR